MHCKYRGMTFTLDKFEKFTDNESIQHVLVAVGTPRANSQIERFNRYYSKITPTVITPMIAKLCDESYKWDRVLNQVEYAINNTFCRSTGKTSSKLFGVQQLGKINDKLKLVLDANTNRDLVTIRESTSKKLQKKSKGKRAITL